MTIAELVHTGPVTRETETHYKQACMVHSESDDPWVAVAAAPGGSAAGWMVMPIWGTSITALDEDAQPILDEDGRPIVESFITSNPRINAKKEKMWLLVRNIEC